MREIKLDIEYIREYQKGLHIENTNLTKALEAYETKEFDLLAGDFSLYYLEAIDSFVTFRMVNIIIEIIHHSRRKNLSEYAEIRACEDYVLKTDWFQESEDWIQSRIREDFYNYFIDEIRLAYDRRKRWKTKNR